MVEIGDVISSVIFLVVCLDGCLGRGKEMWERVVAKLNIMLTSSWFIGAGQELRTKTVVSRF